MLRVTGGSVRAPSAALLQTRLAPTPRLLRVNLRLDMPSAGAAAGTPSAAGGFAGCSAPGSMKADGLTAAEAVEGRPAPVVGSPASTALQDQTR